MTVRSTPDNNGHHPKSLEINTPAPRTNRRPISIPEWEGPSDRDLEGLLSSALLAGDKELGRVVREVDEISKALKSGTTTPQALRVAVHPAVWSAVRHVIVERELRHLALTDDLTCLYNRRGFFAAATQQLKLARRNTQCMLLFFCDVDNLKKINDSFGHREGDLALVRTADALEDAFRDSDILARLGGDEFAVLAMAASSENEAIILHRLEKALEKSNANEPRYKLALSVGMARFEPNHVVSLGVLMEKADQDMYEQKRLRKAHCASAQ